nr:immunoglobulin heavy chain junction region [Mus musculus]
CARIETFGSSYYLDYW